MWLMWRVTDLFSHTMQSLFTRNLVAKGNYQIWQINGKTRAKLSWISIVQNLNITEKKIHDNLAGSQLETQQVWQFEN